MFNDSRIFGALAILLFAYVLIAILAWSARGVSLNHRLRRWWAKRKY
jgi:hypothetical protein